LGSAAPTLLGGKNKDKSLVSSNKDLDVNYASSQPTTAGGANPVGLQLQKQNSKQRDISAGGNTASSAQMKGISSANQNSTGQ
jgi:hypothetical protein